MALMRKIVFILTGLFIAATAYSQDKKDVTMADTLRSNGMIYVVLAVVLIILIGLILYMVRVDRKISKLEKDN